MATYISLGAVVQLLTILLGFFFFASANSQATTSHNSDPDPTTTAAEITTSSEKSTPTSSRIISLFYINENAYSGLPYNQVHQAYGSVIGVDDTATTYVFTTTRILLPTSSSSITDVLFTTEDLLTGPDNTMFTLTVPSTRSGTHFSAPGVIESMVQDDDTTTIAAEASMTTEASPATKTTPTLRTFTTDRITGSASTITQGPSTFEYTGVNKFAGPSHSVINRCELKDTTEATCLITHIGTEWYTASEWDGEYKTRSYTWTTGDILGFAPVTMTAGLEMLSENGASSLLGGNGAGAAGLLGGALMGLVAVLVML